MSNGVVKWFSSKKGYGFITMEDGQEVFVHYTSIDGNGFRSLEQGEEVQFEVAQGPKGLQAAKVLRETPTDVVLADRVAKLYDLPRGGDAGNEGDDPPFRRRKGTAG